LTSAGCTGGSVAVFQGPEQLSHVEQRDWLEFQRHRRVEWDPLVRACLAAPSPKPPKTSSDEFYGRVQRTFENAPRALQECKYEVGAYSLSGKLSLALEFAADGHAVATGVVESHTETDHEEFNQCVRRRFCFLKAWPAERASIGVVLFNTNALQ
jgi:hypothetical protein